MTDPDEPAAARFGTLRGDGERRSSSPSADAPSDGSGASDLSPLLA